MNPRRFFAELKRRNVYKVAVAYAVVAWLLIQAASILFPTFDAPSWVMKVFVTIVFLGFPIALVLAWAFELTPEGIKRTEEVAPWESVTHRTGRRVTAFIVIAAVGAASLLAFQFLRTKSVPPAAEKSLPAATAGAIPLKSIAVLPFASLSEDKANEYFASGIQDEILTRLAKIADLKVISRTSTQQYQSKPGNLPEIAKQLGVAHILEGSVQKVGDAVRINVQLIKAEGDSHLWADTYDRKLTDIFAVESEVAQRIATSLEAKLTGREKEAIGYVGTKIPAAYDAYLRGIALRNINLPEAQNRLLEFCRQAVALDPNYAAAWAEIAFAEGLKYIEGERTEAQRARTQEAAENALRLDSEHGFGHAAMGMYRYYCLQEYDEALVHLQQAREQAPNDAIIIQAIGLVKRRQAKLEESIALQLQAARLDPLNQDIWRNIGFTYRGMRNLVEARAMFDRALAIAPDDRLVLARRAETYVAEGDLATAARLYGELPSSMGALYVLVLERRYDDAIARVSADLEKEKSPSPVDLAIAHFTVGSLHLKAGRKAEAEPLLVQAEGELKSLQDQGNRDPEVLGHLIELYALRGRRAEVDRLAPELITSQGKDRWWGPFAEQTIARVYAHLGDTERAVALLEKLQAKFSAGAWTPAMLRLDPVWDPIRNDPRFQKMAGAKP